MRRFTLIVLAVCFACFFGYDAVQAAPRLQETEEDRIVIVIDPGHGGENLGTTENGHVEKDMNMTTALAMYEELSLYENVEVYLTHTQDVNMSLKERADFAESVGADFLFSIHYNASENHELFGTEVWVSIHAPYNGYGYQFGYELLRDMERSKGLFVRGIKARRGEKDPDSDYYGIIRYSVEKCIPAVIIEHCHVDEAHDAKYCGDEEALKSFGRADAAAVAKYFGLKSSVLNVDYAGYPLAESSLSACVESTLRDDTAPEACRIELQSADYEEKNLTFLVSAADSDSVLLYYSYSVDGGKSFSVREIWPESDALAGSCAGQFTLTVPVLSGTRPEVIVRAYNMYDLYADSNCYVSPQTVPTDCPDWEENLEIIPVDGDVYRQEAGQEVDLEILLKAVFAAFLVLGGMIFVLHFMTRRRR